MNSFRTALVDKVFSKLDKDGDGVIRVTLTAFKNTKQKFFLR